MCAFLRETEQSRKRKNLCRIIWSNTVGVVVIATLSSYIYRSFYHRLRIYKACMLDDILCTLDNTYIDGCTTVIKLDETDLDFPIKAELPRKNMEVHIENGPGYHCPV
jgi:hypothetical protein